MHYRMEDLKQLINAMSGAEKRYFTLFSETFAQPAEPPLYLQLFQWIAKPGTEPPDFKKEISDQASTTTKTRLFRNILKVMCVFHHEKSPEIMIQNYLSETEVLFHMNLPTQCLFPLTKAYLLASRFEKFGLLLQVLEWERRLNMILDNPTRSIDSIRTEIRKVMAQLQQVITLETIYSKAKELKKKHGYIKGDRKAGLRKVTIAAGGMPDLKGCLSKKAVYYYNFIHALFYWMVLDHNRAYQFSKELLGQDIQLVLPEDYIDGILEHVTSCVCIGHFEAALNGLEITAEYLEAQKLRLSIAYRLKLFYYKTCYHLIIYNYTGEKNKLRAAVKATEAEMKQLEGQLPLETRLVLTANLMNAHLGLGNHKKVTELWDGIFKKQSQTARRDIYDDLYFFRMFHLLQTTNYEILPSLATSAFRYYKKFSDHQKHFSLELAVASILSKEHDYSKTETKREILEEIKAQLAFHIAGFKDTNGFQEHYTLYVIWIESLISGRPFHEEAAGWHKKYST